MNNQTSCLNCGQKLELSDNYCPNCGQENRARRISFAKFLQEFFSNYLSFDTIIFKTAPLFLFKPGRLTNEFNAGKRRKYVNPIRLYLIFSLFYFFIIGLTIPKNAIDKGMSQLMDGNPIALGELDSTSRQTLLDLNIDQDSLETLQGRRKLGLKKRLNPSKNNWLNLKYMAAQDTVTDAAFEEYMKANNLSIGVSSTETKRAFIANSNIFVYQAVRNLPLMMFLLLPLFALLLWVSHLSSKMYFIEHLIHGLHLHSFAYLIYGLIILVLEFVSFEQEWLFFIGFIIVTTYSYISFKKVYRSGWIKEFFKFIFVGILYLFILIGGIFAELYLSLLSL